MSDVHSTGALRNCRDDGRCQYAIDHGAEGLGHCSPKCVMPRDQVGALRQQPEAVDHDRALLELAALAYWGDEIDDVCSIRWLQEDRAIGFTHGDNQDHNGIDQEYLWNPLEDDGDALRLAVKLAIDVTHYPTFPGCYEAFSRGHWCLDDESFGECDEPHGDDPCAATRRAIVRAAAQIGSELLKTASGSHQEARSNEQGEST